MKTKTKKQKSLSPAQRRHAGAWLTHYNRLMAKPLRGVITYGGGLAIRAWIAEAELQGFHCTITSFGVVLR